MGDVTKLVLFWTRHKWLKKHLSL